MKKQKQKENKKQKPTPSPERATGPGVGASHADFLVSCRDWVGCGGLCLGARGLRHEGSCYRLKGWWDLSHRLLVRVGRRLSGPQGPGGGGGVTLGPMAWGPKRKDAAGGSGEPGNGVAKTACF